MEVTSNRVKVADPVVSGVSGVLVLVAQFTNWFSFLFFCLFVCLFFVFLRPDYMVNFSPVNRAETSARLLKQILLKSNCRLHGEGFSPGRNSARAKNPSPVCSNRDRIFSPGKRARKSENLSCNQNVISARAE